MTYRVDLSARATRDLRRIHQAINSKGSLAARTWFNGLESAILNLDEHPGRCPVTPENGRLHHLLYGHRRNVYRVVFSIDEGEKEVKVLHVRHGARRPFGGTL